MWKLALATFFFLRLTYAVDPSSLKVKVYGAWLSPNEDCSEPVRLFSSSDPIYLNILGRPSLGSLDNTNDQYNGNYHCFIIQISEVLKFVPSSNNGYCTAGTEYTSRLCSAGQSTVDPETGEVSSCSGSTTSEDVVFLYMSTLSTATSLDGSSGPFQAPANSNTLYGIQLSGVLGISGGQATKFVVNANDKIESHGSTCRLNTPVFSFGAN